jgi:hypothetical protein
MVYELPNLKDTSFTRIDYIDLSNFFLFGSETDPSFKKTDNIKAYLYTGSSFTDSGGVQVLNETFDPITVNGSVIGRSATSFTKVAGNRFFIKFIMKKYLGQTLTMQAIKVKYGV